MHTNNYINNKKPVGGILFHSTILSLLSQSIHGWMRDLIFLPPSQNSNGNEQRGEESMLTYLVFVCIMCGFRYN